MINNIDVLKNAVLTDDTTVNASMYHDSFIWRTIALCVNERCLPVILVTSDRYSFNHSPTLLVENGGYLFVLCMLSTLLFS